ncbi:hypothetical protein KDW_39760 [Dictyobacter vulcani]|uniref:Uncharacterized protein n=1 Tax=Dictyobacter vulcani TaxID=2607529 RepID=A0A5J4KJZ5_9CHLR|nr:CRISPR-associated protein Csx3 [Dictyobacter vulcani]GER89814.1 hypothetical protein KDW_39760 [Dictyobacter vulcani]
MERIKFEQAPGELLNFYTFVPANERWQPDMLPWVLEQLPRHVPLSLYGVAPTWAYAAVAAATGDQPLTQFDPRLPFGWIQPLPVQLSQEQHPDAPCALLMSRVATILRIKIPTHLEYFQPAPFPLPPVPRDRGLIIHGKMPYWLLTALARFYRDQHLPWLATYYPPINKAIVIYARRDVPYRPGDIIDMPRT